MRLSRILRVSFNKVFHRQVIEAELVKAHFEADRMSLTVKHPGAVDIAKQLSLFYLDSGSPNFLEMKLFDPETLGTLVLTIRQQDGLTPAEVNGKLREVVERFQSGDETAHQFAKTTMSELGYE